MKTKSVWCIFIFVILASGCASSSSGSKDYRLVWSDEFEVNGKPNPENWTYEHGFERNEELQWYQSENAFCTNGLLVIEARREKKKNPRYRADNSNWRYSRENIDYTSACLITRGLHSWQYGRFEIKARIKTEEGLWPAIWFLGIEGNWPHNGEIDLMEYYDNHILANACWGTDQRHEPEWDSVRKAVESFDDPSFDEKFHVWRMDWNKDFIKLYIDGILLNTIDLSQTENPSEKWGPKNPFHQPHYLLLNLAIGGKMGGDPSHTDFPSRYEIDYVRVYQRAE